MQIISTRPRNPRRGTNRRGAARAEVLGKTGASPSTRARYAGALPAANGAKAATTSSNADKIIISNLPDDVNETQIKVCLRLTTYISLSASHLHFQELFSSTVGPTREVTLHYNSSGKSKGVASVTFRNRDHCTKAYQTYNNRLIDGS
jgi:THO complex subunit 4